jgi:hypothetical protein
MLDSVWGTVPIGADAFSMIGGDLVEKKSPKVVFFLLLGYFWPCFHWLLAQESMFWSCLGWLRLAFVCVHTF